MANVTLKVTAESAELITKMLIESKNALTDVTMVSIAAVNPIVATHYGFMETAVAANNHLLIKTLIDKGVKFRETPTDEEIKTRFFNPDLLIKLKPTADTVRKLITDKNYAELKLLIDYGYSDLFKTNFSHVNIKDYYLNGDCEMFDIYMSTHGNDSGLMFNTDKPLVNHNILIKFLEIYKKHGKLNQVHCNNHCFLCCSHVRNCDQAVDFLIANDALKYYGDCECLLSDYDDKSLDNPVHMKIFANLKSTNLRVVGDFSQRSYDKLFKHLITLGVITVDQINRCVNNIKLSAGKIDLIKFLLARGVDFTLTSVEWRRQYKMLNVAPANVKIAYLVTPDMPVGMKYQKCSNGHCTGTEESGVCPKCLADMDPTIYINSTN